MNIKNNLLICWLWIKLKSLEITAQGQIDVLLIPTIDLKTKHKVHMSHVNTLHEIVTIKSKIRRLQNASKF